MGILLHIPLLLLLSGTQCMVTFVAIVDDSKKAPSGHSYYGFLYQKDRKVFSYFGLGNGSSC